MIGRRLGESRTQNTIRLFRRVVPKQPAGKEIPSITRQEAGHRSEVKLRVRRFALLESDRGSLGHGVQGECAVLVSHGIPLAEECHVHRGGVAGNVDVVTGIGGVGFDEVMRAC